MEQNLGILQPGPGRIAGGIEDLERPGPGGSPKAEYQVELFKFGTFDSRGLRGRTIVDPPNWPAGVGGVDSYLARAAAERLRASAIRRQPGGISSQEIFLAGVAAEAMLNNQRR